MGSVAAKVIGLRSLQRSCSSEAAKIGYHKISVASDGSEHGNAAAVKPLA